MFGLTIWHAICIMLTLLWLITAYRLHVSKRQRFDARGLPIIDKIRPMPKSSVRSKRDVLSAGSPQSNADAYSSSGSDGGCSGGDSGSC